MGLTMNIQAIETQFDGHLFRSRTEARWAVFFKEMGWKYQYEVEGFNLNGVRYLPDFFLPELDCWFEVKGSIPTQDEADKLKALVEATARNALLAWGAPKRGDHDGEYHMVHICRDKNGKSEWLSLKQFDCDLPLFVYFGNSDYNFGLMVNGIVYGPPGWPKTANDCRAALDAASSARFEFGAQGSLA